MADDIELREVPDRHVVVTALPLRRAARDRLAERLGAVVVDIRDTVDEADLVLTPSCSPQTVARLAAAYPSADLVVVELEDWEFGIELGGPVRRLLDAGAARYLVADGIDDLARLLGATMPAGGDEPSARELSASPMVDDLILANVQDLVERRAAVTRRRD